MRFQGETSVFKLFRRSVDTDFSSSSLNKGNHDCDSVYISDSKHITFFRFISPFSP